MIVNSIGQLLVVNQNGTSWSLPKGKLDPGENTRQAAAREIKEETGITQLNYVKQLGTYQRYQIAKDGSENKNELKNITMFLYTTPEMDLRPEDPHNPEARWVEIDEVVDLLTHPKDKHFFQSIVSEVKQLIDNG